MPGGNTFVIQQHHATALHWDFRLERDGVLVSWAVPKGVPTDPAVNRLAVHVDDHALDHATYTGRAHGSTAPDRCRSGIPAPTSPRSGPTAKSRWSFPGSGYKAGLYCSRPAARTG